MVDLNDRTHKYTITTDCAERIPGGFVLRGVNTDWKRREYRHSNPSKYYKLRRRKQWKRK